jgi:hypothetical protein
MPNPENTSLAAISPKTSAYLLDLVDDLLCLGKALYHLLAILPPLDSVLGLLEQLIQFVCLVHVGEKLTLHILLGPLNEIQHNGLGYHIDHRAADNVEV